MDQNQILRVMLSLLFVLALLLALAWIARHRGWLRGQNRADHIRVLGSQRLGARCAVTLVQVDGARLVLGVTPQQITLLHRLPPDEAASQPTADRFAATLGNALSRS